MGGQDVNETKLLKFCFEAKSISALMIAMNWKNRTKFGRRFLIPLVQQGMLAMTIPDKPNSRLQKYIITDAGKKRHFK